MKFQKAFEVFRAELRKDSDLYLAYQANIAMAFYDEYRRTGNNLSYHKVHKVANKAAKNFLDLLIKKEGPAEH